jgi:beta-phosphoglucomutase-like phosphatase (HAD superfamily)
MKHFLGAIYDFDDTLLNNYPAALAPHNIHELSRAEATSELGKELGIHEIIDISHEQHLQAFMEAPEHSMEGASWQLLCMLGLEKGEINHEHPLLRNIRSRKAAHYKKLYDEYCEPIKGAVACVQTFHEHGRPQAIASGAQYKDIKVFLDKFALNEQLPKHKVIAWGDYTSAKPHPESFERAFLRLGLPDEPEIRSQVVAFEDDPRGVESAKRAGLYTCALLTRIDRETFMNTAYPPDMIASDFDEFMR